MLLATAVAVLSFLTAARAYTNAQCAALGYGANYACNYYFDSSCGCGQASQQPGSLACCDSDPNIYPGCANFPGDTSLKTCSQNAACYGPYAPSGPCTGCGTSGSQVEIAPCNGIGSDLTQTVTVTCGTPKSWSTWSAWSKCSASCGSGTQTATRKCTGTCGSCSGSGTRSQNCTGIQPYSWGSWSAWSTLCSSMYALYAPSASLCGQYIILNLISA